MAIFDRYLIKNLFLALLFVALALAAVIFLTQSLRFLELVFHSGASAASFWLLTLLALPRFFEIILPIALTVAIVFVYNRMMTDSELIVMKAIGSSPMILARPALILTLLTTVFLWSVTMWMAPASIGQMYRLRQVIQDQYTSLFFKEGVFTPVGDGITVFIRERARNGELRGVMIHDNRKEIVNPVTILAKSGRMISTDSGQQVLVQNGSRQEYNRRTRTLSRLDFERYTIELPDSTPIKERWREPDERTFTELLAPDPDNPRDLENVRQFIVEAHKRIASPLLAPAFAAITLACLLLGAIDRRGQTKRIVGAVFGVILIQGLFLVSYNLSRQTGLGVPLMYAVALLPAAGGVFLLSGSSEAFRKTVLHKMRTAA